MNKTKNIENIEKLKEIFLSVVIPVYNEEENVALLYGEIAAAVEGIFKDVEIIFINDG
ncbi:MAG: glycosyltransferase, partial [bacterium]|nr:glycosyltransferase [bacterium]